MLMRELGVGVSDIDDIETAVQAMTTPEQQPILHYWSTNARSREWTAEALAPAVEAVVRSHLDDGPAVIMEGDYLLPASARRMSCPEVRTVFVYESDESRLLANFLGREQHAGPQRMRARVSWLFGQWLASETPRHAIAAIPARPWDTLPERVHGSLRSACR